MADKKVILLASCEQNVGNRHWVPPSNPYGECYGPDDDWRLVYDTCSYEGEVEVDKDEVYYEENGEGVWDAECFSMTCPSCGQLMEGFSGHFEFAEDPT